jgi:hypothetical protein
LIKCGQNHQVVLQPLPLHQTEHGLKRVLEVRSNSDGECSVLLATERLRFRILEYKKLPAVIQQFIASSPFEMLFLLCAASLAVGPLTLISTQVKHPSRSKAHASWLGDNWMEVLSPTTQ